MVSAYDFIERDKNSCDSRVWLTKCYCATGRNHLINNPTLTNCNLCFIVDAPFHPTSLQTNVTSSTVSLNFDSIADALHYDCKCKDKYAGLHRSFCSCYCHHISQFHHLRLWAITNLSFLHFFTQQTTTRNNLLCEQRKCRLYLHSRFWNNWSRFYSNWTFNLKNILHHAPVAHIYFAFLRWNFPALKNISLRPFRTMSGLTF